MAYTIYKQQSDDAKRLRKEAGQYIKGLRARRDMSQLDLAKLLGIDYTSFVSAVETGANRVPPDTMKDWAVALGVDRREFAKTLLSYYDPFMFEELFGRGGTS